jgi:hypothetical protein
VADSFVWLRVTTPGGWQVLLTALTVFIAAIAVRTLAEVFAGPDRRNAAKALSADDDADAVLPP